MKIHNENEKKIMRFGLRVWLLVWLDFGLVLELLNKGFHLSRNL